MKKVLIISNMYPTPTHPSYGVFVQNQVHALQNAGIETLLSVNTDPRTGAKNALRKYVKWTKDTLQLATQNRSKLSVVHAHYVFPSGMIALMIKKALGIPFVVTAHGGDIEKMARKNKVLFSLSKRILHESARIQAVGPLLKDQIVKDFGVAEDKVVVMSMGVDRSVFSPVDDRMAAKKDVHMTPGVFTYLFVGNVIRQKGVEELLKAYHQIRTPETELVIVGSTRDKAFLETLDPYRTEDVRFVEPLPQHQLVRYFQAADVFVLPSHIEGLGLVALEALATSTPVIASRAGGLPSLLDGGAGVLVPPRDETALASEMKKALETPYTEYFNAEAANRAVAEHDDKRLLQKLLAIYKEVGHE